VSIPSRGRRVFSNRKSIIFAFYKSRDIPSFFLEKSELKLYYSMKNGRLCIRISRFCIGEMHTTLIYFNYVAKIYNYNLKVLPFTNNNDYNFPLRVVPSFEMLQGMTLHGGS
jgi:hypothetical protein